MCARACASLRIRAFVLMRALVCEREMQLYGGEKGGMSDMMPVFLPTQGTPPSPRHGHGMVIVQGALSGVERFCARGKRCCTQWPYTGLIFYQI